jgi:hypothetical protein
MVCGGTNCRRLIDYVFAATSEDDPIDSEVTDEKILTLSSGVMQNNAQLTPQDIVSITIRKFQKSVLTVKLASFTYRAVPSQYGQKVVARSHTAS